MSPRYTAAGAARIWEPALLLLLIAFTVLTAVTATRAPRGAAATGPVRLAVVGGSWAAGVDNRVVWPTLLAEQTGWQVASFALPGAGLVVDGEGGHAFTYQVDRALRAGADYILIAADSADNGGADAAALRTGLSDLLTRITLAGQRPVVIGPTWYATPVPVEVQRVSDALREAADGLSVPFFDALDPPWLTPKLMGGWLSAPTDAGQAVMADHIARLLREQVIG